MWAILFRRFCHKKECGLIPDNQILVNGRSGPCLMSKDKWPTLTLPTEIKTQVICSQKRQDGGSKDQML
jgi:hypothetical protein